ncbi:ATP-grasp fold amidoligase family protein [Butyrivibrio sp. WCD2001]|uniref:ATP-grasp fold amidoligase family protein n=1 Tax=Butyrivibrio sp. WCD2001 TaxID=1280681 RepID=UPI0004271768|nr:ATP-grasp fold amidoligase family protein [Butyrivibrio sp. WCD2001]
MDYKKIIKSQKVRLAILQALGFVPDKMMISIQYRIKTGRKLNIKTPNRFTEKLQWYKLNYKNPLMIKCVDKADVREYVIDKGMKSILIPCYGVYETIEEIPWDSLPRSFVIKDTLGMGGASVKIIKDKNAEKKEEVYKLANAWVHKKSNVKTGGREWPYYSGKRHRIIIEEYIEPNDDACGLIDYKFFCFNGVPKYIYVISDRIIGKQASLGIYDENFNAINAYRTDEKKLERKINKPENFEEMKHVARTLSEGFPEVRIDLYSVKGRILFGEMTFWDGSGYMKYDPDDFDFEIGSCFEIPKHDEMEE